MAAGVKASYCMHFDTVAEHSAVNSEKYAAISTLIKRFENRFQDFLKKKNHQFSGIFATPFSTDKYITFEFSNVIYRVARCSTQREFWSSLFTKFL